jgi:hypothetical protein
MTGFRVFFFWKTNPLREEIRSEKVLGTDNANYLILVLIFSPVGVHWQVLKRFPLDYRALLRIKG